MVVCLPVGHETGVRFSGSEFFIFKKDTAFYIYRKLGEKTTKKQKDNEEDFMKLE